MRYHWLSALSLLTAVLLPIALVTPLEPWYDIKVKHTWNSVPVNWESQGHPPAAAEITLYIALKPERESALIDALTEVSNPKHPRYGAYLSQEQVAELVRPHPDTFELISAWLVHHGIRSSSISMTHGGGWLTVSEVLVSQANEMLGASYQLYRNAKTKDTIIRTVGYGVPVVLHGHIKTVAPTTYFPSTRVKQQTPRKRSLGSSPAHTSSGNLITPLSSRVYIGPIEPDYLRWLYRTFPYRPTANGRNRLAVVGFDGEFPSQEDLTEFMTRFSQDAQATTFTYEQVNGGVNVPNHSGLANTDVQYAAAMSYPTPLIFYSVGGQLVWEQEEGQLKVPIAGDKYLQWFGHVLWEQNIPQTISISDGDIELALPPEYAANVCFLFAVLGAQGVSVLTASGSAGVGPEGADDCTTTDGDVRFIAEFPASCPYVTTVGGTSGLPEVAVYLSGGGFSAYFPRVWYQNLNNAVPNFLRDLDGQYEDLFNSSNRGYPDIASQAYIYQLVVDNEVLRAQGTPCAVSTVAGIISLINDFLISRNRSPLGFLNPWLYGVGSAGLNDITSGHNPGCGTQGFYAVPGWDAVTGLGTLNFEILLDIIVKSWPKAEQPP